MLTRIICNDAVSDRIKCIALSSIHRTIENNLPGEKDTDRETRTVLGDYDPAPLWAYCQRLAADMTQDVYRPTFGTRTVPSAVAVLRGGRRAEHKPGGPNRPPKSVVYAREGIPLDGSLGNEVSFSCRIQRTIVAESLGRYYYVGVACVKPSDSQQATNDDGGHELNYYPGVRLKQPFVYDITDSIKVENNLAVVTALRRHEDHWLSKEDQLVFGSGDIITVTVNCAQRSVAFARNGKSLGTVYNKGIAPLVTVLYPCVELYNKDSSVTWMYHIRELSVLARYTMRVMLQCWQTELIEPLKQLLSRSREGVCTALQVLGSDGEELAATYHAPPSADVVSTSHNVRIIRMEEGWTTIEDDAGTLLQVTSGAVEPDYLSRVSIDFADKMDVLLLLLDLVKDLIQMEDPNRIVVAHRHVLVRVLRLLSEWTPDYMTAMVENPLPPTAVTEVRLL
ncbi:hypothetical protein ADEAN_000886100 [Angomonas deanei]|uniref:SPRY domain containing protein n=1 Tax=Angomonas deanei TaxID=59799 RepID=A0A7G2CPP6_9TRYP|nr:hypothetical protein ADEAN_000886100 [Angomonas deanei]